MFLKLIILSSLIIAFALVAMGIRILFSKRRNFPEYHIGHNREMKKLGIKCAQNTDIGCSPSTTNKCHSCSYYKGTSNSLP